MRNRKYKCRKCNKIAIRKLPNYNWRHWYKILLFPSYCETSGKKILMRRIFGKCEEINYFKDSIKNMPKERFTVINSKNQWLCCNVDAVWFWVDNQNDRIDYPLQWQEMELRNDYRDYGGYDDISYIDIDDVELEVRDDMTIYCDDEKLKIEYDV